jgi:hypothetical protein
MVEGTLPLHTQISTKDFITFMLTLLKTKDSPEVQFKILTLIKKWGVRFENKRDILPNFFETYNSLMKNGVEFPENLDSTYYQYLNDSTSNIVQGNDFPDFSNFNISGGNNSNNVIDSNKNTGTFVKKDIISNSNTNSSQNNNSNSNSNKNAKSNISTSNIKVENNYGNVCLDLNPENYPKKYRKFVTELVTLLNYITLANV